MGLSSSPLGREPPLLSNSIHSLGKPSQSHAFNCYPYGADFQRDISSLNAPLTSRFIDFTAFSTSPFGGQFNISVLTWSKWTLHPPPPRLPQSPGFPWHSEQEMLEASSPSLTFHIKSIGKRGPLNLQICPDEYIYFLNPSPPYLGHNQSLCDSHLRSPNNWQQMAPAAPLWNPSVFTEATFPKDSFQLLTAQQKQRGRVFLGHLWWVSLAQGLPTGLAKLSWTGSCTFRLVHLTWLPSSCPSPGSDLHCLLKALEAYSDTLFLSPHRLPLRTLLYLWSQLSFSGELHIHRLPGSLPVSTITITFNPIDTAARSDHTEIKLILVCRHHKVRLLQPHGSHLLFADSTTATQLSWLVLDPLGMVCLPLHLTSLWSAFVLDKYTSSPLSSFRSVTFYLLILLNFSFIEWNHYLTYYIYILFLCLWAFPPLQHKDYKNRHCVLITPISPTQK